MAITNLEIMGLTRYPGWKEMCTAAGLEFLVIIFKIDHNIYYSFYFITDNPEYPQDNSIIVHIYKGNNI